LKEIFLGYSQIHFFFSKKKRRKKKKIESQNGAILKWHYSSSLGRAAGEVKVVFYKSYFPVFLPALSLPLPLAQILTSHIPYPTTINVTYASLPCHHTEKRKKPCSTKAGAFAQSRLMPPCPAPWQDRAGWSFLPLPINTKRKRRKQGGWKGGGQFKEKEIEYNKKHRGNEKKQRELGNFLWETGRNKWEFFWEKKIKKNKRKQRGDEG